MAEGRRTDRPELAPALLLAATVLLLLATLSETLAPHGFAPQPAILAALVIVAAAAAVRRPSGLGAPTLGLGTAILPPAILLLGTVPAAWLAAAALVASEGLRRLAAERDWRRRPAPTGRSLTLGVASAVLATLAAGACVAAGARAAGSPPSPTTEVLLPWLLVPLWPLVTWTGRRLAGERRHADTLAPAGLEAAGLAGGLLLLPVAVQMGWWTALPILGAGALLALEAGRQRLRATGLRRRLGRLAHVGRAGLRVAAGERGDARALTERLAVECHRVIPFQWLELTLEEGPEAGRRWHMGPDERVDEGPPRAPDTPPPLPGFHRRRPWRVFDRDLEVEGRRIARLRLWCDPRQLRRDDLDLLRELQPQIALSVHQALLGRMAREDPLTGLAARRVLESSLQQAFERACEIGVPITVLMCDLDHFKQINDARGHAVGDEALVTVARILSQHLRDGDLCSRFGGEEFTLLLDGLAGEAGLQVAERLRERVAETPVAADGDSVSLTLSVGVACFPELLIREAEHLLELADQALYEAKRQGRNRSLLNLGDGRFEEPGGKILISRTGPAPARPRIFT